MRMITIIFVLVCFGSVCGESHSKQMYTKDKTLMLLNKALQTHDLIIFENFCDSYNKLNNKSQNELAIDSGFCNSLYRFECSLLRKKKSVRIFETHYFIKTYLKNNAELSEAVDNSFSQYFVGDMKTSLSILEKVRDQIILDGIINSVVFPEGSAEKIVDYIERNNLIKKSYYKLFLPYRTN